MFVMQKQENTISKTKKENKALSIDNYLDGLKDINRIQLQELWDEMDTIWHRLNLDNSKPIATQQRAINEFYHHPVWVLNGLFSESDTVSKKHRLAIANYIDKLKVKKIADFGGGSGVLSNIIATKIPDATIDIIEPYPFEYFVEKNQHPNVHYTSDLKKSYDLIIAQDVLEHVENPIDLTITMFNAISIGGYAIFANCFYPVIQCHLPCTFYLRRTFRKILTYSGIQYVGKVDGARHALIFRKNKPLNVLRLKRADKIAQLIGFKLNSFSEFKSKLKRVIRLK